MINEDSSFADIRAGASTKVNKYGNDEADALAVMGAFASPKAADRQLAAKRLRDRASRLRS